MSDDTTRLRRWLIDKLKQSRWAQRRGENIEQLAVRLGVQPDVLSEAQAELDVERRGAGREPVALGEHQRVGSVHAKGGRRRRSDGATKFIELPFPELVYKDWKKLCGLRGVRPAAMLRSLIHTLLSGPRNPSWTGRWWFYHGRRVPLDFHGHYKRTGKKWPHLAHTEITHGAAAALTRRADALGATMTALTRGMVIDLLEGRVPRVTIITAPSSMFDDERRYWTEGAKKRGLV